MSNVDAVKQRTWQFEVNAIITGGTTQAGGPDDAADFGKNLLLHLKNTMIGFSVNPWTVAGSASFDDLVGAMDATDRWDSIDDIRWTDNTGNNRSWIVLENSALGIQFLFDCVTINNFDGATASCWVAPTSDPFTGGAINARPTSASEVEILDYTQSNAGAWGLGLENNTVRTYIVHAMHSEDGIATRIIIMQNGVPTGWWFFDRIESQVAAMTYPWLARVRAGSSDNTSTAIDFAATVFAQQTFGARDDGVGTGYYMATLYNNLANASGANLVGTSNPFDGRITLWPLAICSESPAWEGFFGEIYDLFIQDLAPGYTGRGYPASSREWMQFGELVFPWNGDAPIVA